MKDKKETEILNEMLEALNEASGSAWQLAHSLQDPRFLPIRDALEMVRNGCIQLASGGML